MRRIRLRVAYDGTAYCGWQVQPEVPTIEGELNQAISTTYEGRDYRDRGKPHRCWSPCEGKCCCI